MNTTTAGQTQRNRFAITASGALVAAVAAMACKLPQAAAALLLGRSGADWMPEASSPTAVLLGLAWLLSSMVLLWLRSWIGLASSVWFGLISLISGAHLLATGYPWWGGWQVLTAAVGVVAALTAAVLGAFKGARW